jgi:hypothetical protein
MRRLRRRPQRGRGRGRRILSPSHAPRLSSLCPASLAAALAHPLPQTWRKTARHVTLRSAAPRRWRGRGRKRRERGHWAAAGPRVRMLTVGRHSRRPDMRPVSRRAAVGCASSHGPSGALRAVLVRQSGAGRAWPLLLRLPSSAVMGCRRWGLASRQGEVTRRRDTKDAAVGMVLPDAACAAASSSCAVDAPPPCQGPALPAAQEGACHCCSGCKPPGTVRCELACANVTARASLGWGLPAEQTGWAAAPLEGARMLVLRVPWAPHGPGSRLGGSAGAWIPAGRTLSGCSGRRPQPPGALAGRGMAGRCTAAAPLESSPSALAAADSAASAASAAGVATWRRGTGSSKAPRWLPAVLPPDARAPPPPASPALDSRDEGDEGQLAAPADRAAAAAALIASAAALSSLRETGGRLRQPAGAVPGRSGGEVEGRCRSGAPTAALIRGCWRHSGSTAHGATARMAPGGRAAGCDAGSLAAPACMPLTAAAGGRRAGDVRAEPKACLGSPAAAPRHSAVPHARSASASSRSYSAREAAAGGSSGSKPPRWAASHRSWARAAALSLRSAGRGRHTGGFTNRAVQSGKGRRCWVRPASMAPGPMPARCPQTQPEHKPALGAAAHLSSASSWHPNASAHARLPLAAPPVLPISRARAARRPSRRAASSRRPSTRSRRRASQTSAILMSLRGWRGGGRAPVSGRRGPGALRVPPRRCTPRPPQSPRAIIEVHPLPPPPTGRRACRAGCLWRRRASG